MRVAFITHYNGLYGANRVLLNLIDGLGEHEVSSYVVSPGSGGDITSLLHERGIPVATLPIRWWMSERPSLNGVPGHICGHLRCKFGALKRLYRNLIVLPRLVQQLRDWAIDIVYTNSSVIPIGALAARWRRLPHVWHVHEFGDLDYGLYPDWGIGIFRRLLGSADALITVSNSVRSHYMLGNASDRAHVVYNGVAWKADFDRLYEVARAASSSRKPYTFALVGYIHSNKGQEQAIRALAIVANRLPEVRLLIVGGGEICELERLASELGVADKIEFWGHISDPYRAFLAADAALMCSKNEAMGLVTVEAMSACKPVIGYNNAGTSEIVQHKQTGLLYKDGPKSLALCMLRFIEDPEWARQLGEYGWLVAREKYSIEAHAANLYGILGEL